MLFLNRDFLELVEKYLNKCTILLDIFLLRGKLSNHIPNIRFRVYRAVKKYR